MLVGTPHNLAGAVWPCTLAACAGPFNGLLESWSAGESIYFSFVTGLTIGYGDLVPLRFITRVIAIQIDFAGILTTGLAAAIGVRALQAVRDERQEPE